MPRVMCTERPWWLTEAGWVVENSSRIVFETDVVISVMAHLLMQRTPYSSLSAETIPGQRETDRWLELSQPLTGVAGSELASDA